MSILIFIIILAVLILVHELGHFLAAKRAGIKVKEFGIGFPPSLWRKTAGETTYSVNLIPFGGFVKILGEDPHDEDVSAEERARSMVYKSRLIQATVLAAGVFFNIAFAWLLISLGYMSGLPTPISQAKTEIRNPRLVVTLVTPDSPAARSEIKPGDAIISVSSGRNSLQELTPQTVSNFIEAHGREQITVVHARGGQTYESILVPKEGIIAGRRAIGVGMDIIGIQKLPVHQAFYEAAKTTVNLTIAIAKSIGKFIVDAFRGEGKLSQITGPVGIVGLVGDVSELGFIYVLSFTAFISVNLAVINMLPFPALDGGRILFLLIEAIKGSPIKPAVSRAVNGIGFAVLILLMIVVTIHDIVKLF
ncbi:RIP metalloprotease RseP [Patescibacteria group bacterium]|nr:MAG: RIP metalloprotease RseP [Patescibacteria group bacterium]